MFAVVLKIEMGAFCDIIDVPCESSELDRALFIEV